MEITCTNCEKTFFRPDSWKKSSQPFCGFKCYGEWQKGKSFREQNKPEREKRKCSIDGCNKKHFGKGYCRKHYLEKIYNTKRKAKKRIIKPRLKKVCKHCGNLFTPHRETAIYCSIKCSSEHRKKPFIIKKGYKKILIPTHHRADKKGYVFEYIIIAEAKIGRRLIDREEIHHIDRNKLNNKYENIVVCNNHSEHMALHRFSP